MSQDKFEVSIDEKTNILSVYVEVDARPHWKGFSYYDISRVLAELKKLNHNVSEKNCLDKSRPVRSDDGERNTSGVWRFKLPKQKIVQPPKPKVIKPKVIKPKVIKPKVIKPRKTTRKKTNDVIE